MRDHVRRYSIYGLSVESDYPFRTPLPSAPRRRAAGDEATLRLSYRIVESARPLAQHRLVYGSTETNPLGESVVQLYQTPEGWVMRYPRVADFRISRGAVECELLNAEYGYLLEICLLSDVLTLMAEQRGRCAIHAGALALDGGAVVLTADSGGGKSTMVASLLAAGASLMADDISVLEPTVDGPVCYPAYPQLKLDREQVEAFVRPPAGKDEFALVHPAFPKLAVQAERVGTFTPHPLPLRGIYLLHRVAALDGAVSVEAVPAPEALMYLIRNSFLAEMTDAVLPRAERLRRLSAIVKAVPVRRLRYPSGYHHLPAVHRALRGDLTGGAA